MSNEWLKNDKPLANQHGDGAYDLPQTPSPYCRPGEGEKTCAYLMMGGAGFECSKGTSMQSLIEERISRGTLKSKGNNCSGPTAFVPSPQGPTRTPTTAVFVAGRWLRPARTGERV